MRTFTRLAKPTQEPPHLELLRIQEDLNGGMIKASDLGQEISKKILRRGCEAYLNEWITADPRMNAVKNTVRRLAKRDDPVLIIGPSGTGKELIARALHGDRGGKFIAENCGGLSKDLIPSVFFGYKKGAFTGANENREGKLVAAKHGTIFLDEIGDMPLEAQALLLRAIQENEVYPVGDVESIRINCRFVAATKKNVVQMVKDGTFREDLYARLSMFDIDIIGLKDRPADINLILQSMPEYKTLVEVFGPDDPRMDLEHHNDVLPDIYEINVRAIQRFARRMLVNGHYRSDGQDMPLLRTEVATHE